MNAKLLGLLLAFLVVNVVREGVHDLAIVQVEENCEILLSFFYQILYALVQSANKSKIGLIFILKLRKHLPPGFPALSVDFDDFFLVQDVESLSKEG